MEKVDVITKTRNYLIVLERGFSSLASEIKELSLEGKKACIVTDDKVEMLYGPAVKEVCASVFGQVSLVSFPAGENSKNLDTITDFYRFFVEQKLDRGSIVIALGGGVAGDMAGFAAATFLRGLRFVQIPTTLLAQVDSSVGGKVGVDFLGAKNMIGAFYQPELVYINIDTMNSLSQREFSAGMAEVIKYGLIQSREFYHWIIENKKEIFSRDPVILTELVKQCCQFKSAVVSQDEKESGLREILNYGHTIGHGIESSEEFSLLHGECVGLGMLAAMDISCQKKELPEEEKEKLKDLLAFFHLPVQISGLDAEKVYRQMFLDKKVRDGALQFVLLRQVGEAYRTRNVSEKEIMDAISSIQ